ncbi:MAG: hypothetical protein BWY76_03307 [bacterium ADurb.Bin429]|nr:MAG: hypothetical protein BWY76_03307 [bacterium ADurb.Bin429]
MTVIAVEEIAVATGEAHIRRLLFLHTVCEMATASHLQRDEIIPLRGIGATITGNIGDDVLFSTVAITVRSGAQRAFRPVVPARSIREGAIRPGFLQRHAAVAHRLGILNGYPSHRVGLFFLVPPHVVPKYRPRLSRADAAPQIIEQRVIGPPVERRLPAKQVYHRPVIVQPVIVPIAVNIKQVDAGSQLVAMPLQRMGIAGGDEGAHTGRFNRSLARFQFGIVLSAQDGHVSDSVGRLPSIPVQPVGMRAA